MTEDFNENVWCGCCGWDGDRTDLTPTADKPFIFCPECGSDEIDEV